MNQRNKKHSLWYSLGLGVLLCIAVLVVSTGTAFARYRTERDKSITFVPRTQDHVLMGVLHTVTAEEATGEIKAGDVILQQKDTLVCEDVDGGARLTLAIANGTSASDCSERSLKVRLRLAASLSFWDGEKPVNLYLAVPSAEDPETTESLLAVPVAIEKGTALYRTFGAGWVYTFQGEAGELTWNLPGGAFSPVELDITIRGATSEEASLLQPQITAWGTD